jgi:hypothetical protein
MSRKQGRVLRLIVYPPALAAMTASMAPAFGNEPVIMFPVGWVIGLIVGAIWCAVAEA